MKDLHNTKQKQQGRILAVLGGVSVVVLIGMIAALCTHKPDRKSAFTPPAFEPAALSGMPEAEDALGYTELYQDGMAYRVLVCGVPAAEDDALTVYFTNAAENEVYLKLRVLDEAGNTLGETGLLKPGEYVERVALMEELSAGTTVRFKVMGYEPEDFTSAGSVTLHVTVGGEK